MAHVLTLEEIDKLLLSSSDPTANILWAEMKTTHGIQFEILQLEFAMDEDYYEALLLGCAYSYSYYKYSYNKRWRCWSEKPTPREREETAWLEESNKEETQSKLKSNLLKLKTAATQGNTARDTYYFPPYSTLSINKENINDYNNGWRPL